MQPTLRRRYAPMNTRLAISAALLAAAASRTALSAPEQTAPPATGPAAAETPATASPAEAKPDKSSATANTASGTAPTAPSVNTAPPAAAITTSPEPVPPSEAASAPTSNANATAAAAPASAATAASTGTTPSTAVAVDATAASSTKEPAKLEKSGTSLADRNDAELAMGLSPGAPQTAMLPGGITPSFGAASTAAEDWRFDFHGFLLLPLRVGIATRDKAYVGQKKIVLHGPPRIPGDLETFEYTALYQSPWTQLNFSYGNSFVTATVIVAARSVSEANGFFNPPDQLGINDAFMTFALAKQKKLDISLDVGGFANRYGMMGEYDLGRYGTPVIARLGGMGATATARFDTGRLRYIAEAGFMGQLTKAPVGVEPAGWNGFADGNTGTSFAAHVHGGIELDRKIMLGLHFIDAFVQDDRAATTTQPDGDIAVYGSELRFSMGRFGHFYTALAHTRADEARGVSSVIRVLNAPGGPGLMEQYFGGTESGGTGKLTTVGAEYNLSLGNLLRYPYPFDGRGPDVVLGAFGMFTHVNTPVAAYNGVNKLKYGLEGTYAPLSWFAFGGRYDRVHSDTEDASQIHSIATGRVIFRSDYQSRDQVALQYSHYFNGSGVVVREGYPPVPDPTVEPDANVVSLTASMWW